MQTAVEPITGELVPAEPQTLFHTDDPVEVLARAGTVANALKGALDRGGMIQRIGGRDHVLIAGWQTLGSMLGIVAHVVWTRPLDDGKGWEARAEARTLDGRPVGSAEAMVTRDERNWKRSDEYALRSMAQTRAMSKALRGPLGFVIAFAGYTDTPAEERDPDPDSPPTLPAWAAAINDEAENMWAASLVEILAANEVPDAEREAGHIATALYAHCDETIPDCCHRLTRRIAQLVAPLPPVPPIDSDGNQS